MNEPKYYLIQNNNPESKDYKKFYETRDKFYYENFYNATFCPSEKIALGFINKLNLSAVVVTKKESELKAGIHEKLLKTSFICDVLKAEIEATSSNFPTKSVIGKQLKLNLNRTTDLIKQYMVSFESLAKESNEDIVFDNQLIVQNMLDSFAAISPEDYMDLTDILFAFKHDKKSIMGIVKKIAQDKERKRFESVASKNQISIYDVKGV
ncbi:hypothetical protein AV926_14115 [Myroides marinus]|uniref:Uncharacterized protein n=1 Tax=Myroides marinus TaxID=703342 RepID=A0A161SBK2_9FLAO|nr:hypothetical protein [Myroides marinus]KZE77505.1 hypothetical protein AV926_14115 [Myroides marinus]